MEKRNENGKIILEYDIINDCHNTNFIINDTLSGDYILKTYYSDILKTDIDVYSLYEIMCSYKPDNYIKEYNDLFDKRNIFVEKFKEFGLYNRLYDVLSVIKQKKQDIVLIGSEINSFYNDIHKEYRNIAKSLDIVYEDCDFVYIDLLELYRSIRYNENGNIFLNESELLNCFENNKNTSLFDVDITDSYAFDINCFSGKYEKYIIDKIINDDYLKTKYIDYINNKDIILIDDSLYSNNHLSYIFDILYKTYRPKSITVITAVSKIIKEEK